MFKKVLAVLAMSFGLTACHNEPVQTIQPSAEGLKQLYSEAGTTAMGKPDAPITMVEIFAYDCRYCRQDYPLVEQFAKAHPNVRVIFKPFMAFGEKTKVLPQYASLAAAKQNQFLAMHRALITTNRPLTMKTINNIAKELNLNMGQFHQDLYSKGIEQQIQDNTQLMDSLDIEGIPAVVITQTKLIDHPELADKIPQYLQVGFLSNDILLNLMHKVQKDAVE